MKIIPLPGNGDVQIKGCLLVEKRLESKNMGKEHHKETLQKTEVKRSLI